MEFRKKNNKKRDSKAFESFCSKAQHLVELVLFFPFLVGIIGILTEISYGLYTGIEFNSALNNAVSTVATSEKNEENSTKNQIEDEIVENTKKILNSRKIPYSDSLKVETLEFGDFYVIIGTYSYSYAFKLVNLFFNTIPEKFHFKNVVVTNKALFLPNSYNIYENDLVSNFNNYSGAQNQEEQEDEQTP